MSKNTEIVKKIKREDGSEILRIIDNEKIFDISRNNLGNMIISFNYISQDSTNNYQEFFEFEEGGIMARAIDKAFETCKEDLVSFDTVDGFLFLDREKGSHRFVFMREFYEGTNGISLELARDDYSRENQMLNNLFDSLPKGERVEIFDDDVNLIMTRTESQAIAVSIDNKNGEAQINRTNLVVKKDDELYDMVMRSFFSFGGYVSFDMCNGSLTITNNDNGDFIFSYEKGKNSDPSNGEEFYTVIYDNTVENQALFHLFDLIISSKKAPLETKHDAFYMKTMKMRRGRAA